MIKINNLQARVEDKEILKGINLEINPGEIHAITMTRGQSAGAHLQRERLKD